MSAVDEILNYQRSADEDFYGLLNCTEQATVSFKSILSTFKLIRTFSIWFLHLLPSSSPSHFALVFVCDSCVSFFFFILFLFAETWELSLTL